MIPDDVIQIGKITGAHGIGGAVKVLSYAESTDRFTPNGTLILIDPMGRRQPHRIVHAAAHKNTVRLRLDRVTTRDQAQALMDWKVCIAREDLPPLAPDTYYWRDLIGMDVVSDQGETLGRLIRIIPTGANDVYVVETPPDHRAGGEILIPAIESVVLDIDVQSRRMRVALPEGLI
ncbi:MAG: 16S rRNA processing protein RimM [Desulfatitalea sp.]|nr:ribosome maturation factor RimM [Desulfatitalea sp.]NNJ99545.1 16S rRNA processing protein RimM [Desulfatitalea sp.]